MISVTEVKALAEKISKRRNGKTHSKNIVKDMMKVYDTRHRHFPASEDMGETLVLFDVQAVDACVLLELRNNSPFLSMFLLCKTHTDTPVATGNKIVKDVMGNIIYRLWEQML